MYSGILRLSPDTVGVTLLVATQLEITTVIEMCQNYIENRHDANLLEVEEHTACSSEDNTQYHQVVGLVLQQEPGVKAEEADDGNNCILTSLFCLSDAQMDTGGSSGQELQLEDSSKSVQVIQSPVITSHRQTVATRKPSVCRKRRRTSEMTNMDSSQPENLVSSPVTSFKAEDDPDLNPKSCPIHHYNTRKQSRPSIDKPASSHGVAVQSEPPKQSCSSTDETLPVRIARKRPSSSVSSRMATSAAVYCLPSWRQSRRILLAARVLLVRQMKVTDGGRLRCWNCETVRFTSPSHLRAHVLRRHRQRHRCLCCGQFFASFIALLRHRANKHRRFRRSRSPGKKPDVESPSGQEATVPVHNKCGWCGQKFTTRSQLLEHRQTVHRRRREAASTRSTPACRRVMRIWRCSEKDCGLEFKYKDLLRVHMAERHPDVVFSCPECRFKTQVEHFLKR